jgi:hypothetical protein
MLSNGSTNVGLLLHTPKHRLRGFCGRFERVTPTAGTNAGTTAQIFPPLGEIATSLPVFRQWPDSITADSASAPGRLKAQRLLTGVWGLVWTGCEEAPPAIALTVERAITRVR